MKRNVKIIKICAIISGISGVIVLSWVFYPIIAYQISSPDLMTFISPIPEGGAKTASAANNLDYTKASSWFPTAKTNTGFNNLAPSFYKLSIPRLKIVDANVSIGGEDLAQSLIQYPGTALPGKIGNSAIFGHSVLPSFYSPTNYLTIFSLLPTLVKGDIITVNYD